jgi:hypothetical protein
MSETGAPGGGYPPPGGWGPAGPPPPGWGAPGPYGAQGYPPQGGWGPVGYPSGPPKTAGKAIAILVLGISSLVACIGIPGIVALCLAPGAKREIAASQGRLTGDGLIKAGVICSWVSIALVILVVVVFAIAITIAASTGGGTIEIQTPAQLRSS